MGLIAGTHPVHAAAARRRSAKTFLALVAACICFSKLAQHGSAGAFLAAGAKQHVEETRLSRAEAFRMLPVIASMGAAAAPSFAKSGVTTAWKTRPDGSDDEFHMGGVEWEDIVKGTGSTPKIGQQIAIDFQINATVNEREIIIDETKDKPRDFRFGVGQMIAGFDEGVLGMKTGGVRKLKIPGRLAFGEKAVPPAPGRPGIPKMTDVVAVVSLVFIPGADDVYQAGVLDVEAE